LNVSKLIPNTLVGFDDYLRSRGLLVNTRRAYINVATQAQGNPIDWYKRLVGSRPPIGTVQQARTAISHFLRFQGMKEEQIRAELPPARGRKGETREGLEGEALRLYNAEAEKTNEPIRTVLLLLPRTGLRISELCSLSIDQVKSRKGSTFLSFRGKGDKHRVVPLGPEGQKVLNDWVRQRGTKDGPLFPGRGGPITAAAIRQACRAMQKKHKSLANLTPHVLRHTYATRAVVSGVDISQLQVLLGHEDIKTTQRYLHPTVDDLTHSIGKIEGL